MRATRSRVTVQATLTVAAAAFLLAAALGSGSQKRLQYAFRGQTLGVPYNVTIVGTQDISQEGYRRVSQQIQTRLAEIFTKTSLDLPFSEISRLNAHRGPLPFSPLRRDSRCAAQCPRRGARDRWRV